MQSLTPEALSAREAAELLGVKAQTLYAYASRGLLRRVGTGKRRRYLLEDLERLRTRKRARSGHGPVAAAALSFGDPVLDTSITAISETGPHYRGVSALELAESGASFERVAELLWTGSLPPTPIEWQPLTRGKLVRRAVPEDLEGLLNQLPQLNQGASERHPQAPERELDAGRHWIRSLAELLVPARPRRASPLRIAELLAARSSLSVAIAAPAIDVALVLLADHELNASSFAARIAASTGAHLSACLLAAVAVLSGPRHGGACERVEALLQEAAELRRPVDVIERRARRGDPLPGFGHPLYPRGDPRGRALLVRAEALAKRSAMARTRLAPARAIARAMAEQGLPATVDFGLVALTRSLGCPAGFAALLFALGRSAGWVAHVLEQRGSSDVLRPRARYVGPMPAPGL